MPPRTVSGGISHLSTFRSRDFSINRKLDPNWLPLALSPPIWHLTGMKTQPRAFAMSTATYAPEYQRRCDQTLNLALHHTPAYHAWRSFDSDHDSVFSRLASFSALTKHDLRQHGPQGFVPHSRSIDVGLASGEIELVTTSGTTGDRVTNVWFQPWWDASEAASWRLNSHSPVSSLGAHREAILTSPWCTGFPCEDGFLGMAQRTSGRFLYLSERSDPSLWPDALMDRMVNELNQFQPVILEANPSFLAKLSRHIVHKRLPVCPPPLIILSYENPSSIHLRQIHTAFSSAIASSYGSTEAGYVFMQCEAGRMHQVVDSCHVDFLPFAPEHGGPDIGRILVTTFNNPWRTLVRFDIGDIVRVEDKTPCPCGRHDGLTLASIEGRIVNLTLTPEGHAITQAAVDRVLGSIPGLVEYQLLQIDGSTYHVKITAESRESHHVNGAVLDVLQSLYGSSAKIMIEVVAAVSPDPPGKYRLTKSLIPIDADLLLDPQFAPPRWN